MVKNMNNILTRGQSGKFGDMVFQHNGIIRSQPDTSKRQWSPAQSQHLEKFSLAKAYGRFAVVDKETSDYYTPLLKRWKKKIRSQNVGVYQIAICDFLHPPRLDTAELIIETGTSEYSIKIHASDIFKVKGVSVCIFTTEGEILEEGIASLYHFNIFWSYSIQDPVHIIPESIVEISIGDVPGNMTKKYFRFFKEI
jgi:hypothetical protein